MAHSTTDITSDNFQAQVLESKLPVLVDFTADWCPPCKMIAPIVDEIAHQYVGRMSVGALDSDANPDIIQTYSVMGLPTLILFVNGEAVQRIVGYTPRDRIEAKLMPYLQPQNA
jgi:thioredoxin 1